MATDTGINFAGVSLVELNFKLNKDFKPPKDGIPVDAAFKVKHDFSPDKKMLSTILSVSLFQSKGTKPFTMMISMEGIFLSDDMDKLKKFSDFHSAAHLLPFVREVIGTTTMKAGIPPLLIPPINMQEALSKKDSSKAAKKRS